MVGGAGSNQTPKVSTGNLKFDAAAGSITVSGKYIGNSLKFDTYANFLAGSSGGAAIVNSNETTFQALMIVGNTSSGVLIPAGETNAGSAVRRVKLFDDLYVSNNIYVNNSKVITAASIGSQSANSALYIKPYAASSSAIYTGRTVPYQGAYTYMAYSDPNAPATYLAGLGFGNGVGGSAEISVNWINEAGGMWYRSLRDTTDNWAPWTRLIDTSNIGSQSVSYAATAGTFSTNRTNYSGVTENSVAGQLMWKNYGNNHTIFDASAGTSPSGTAVNKSNPDVSWSANFPNLMGWNGANTYGARVYASTVADGANGNFYIDDNYGNTVVGLYDSFKYQGVFAMGDAYKLPANGSTTGNLYGLAWSHPNAGGAAGNLNNHGLLVLIDGTFGSAISSSIVASGNVTAYSDERLKTNWRSMPDNFVARLAAVKCGIYDRTDSVAITQVGVSAQSLQELLPSAITTASDDMKTLSVSYGNAALASAVELAKDNVELRKRIERLEVIIETLLQKE